jgi:hypothetical protein
VPDSFLDCGGRGSAANASMAFKILWMSRFGMGSRSFATDFRNIAVGTPVAGCPPHRSVREALPHTAPTSDR